MGNSSSTGATAGLAIVVLAFSAFLLFITRTGSGDLSTAAVALVGPLCGAVVAYFFHAQTSGQAAAISAAGTATGLAAAGGQPTSISSGNIRTGYQGTQTGVSSGH